MSSPGNIKRSDRSSQLGRGTVTFWNKNTTRRDVEMGTFDETKDGAYPQMGPGVHYGKINTSSGQLEDQAMSFMPGHTVQDCGVPCCTGDFTNCPCGCQSYTSDTQMNLDPEELEQLRQKCTCACCGLKFHNRSNLRRHEKKHLNIYRHHCAICGRKFSRSDCLKLHMKRKHKSIHSGS